MSTLLVVAAKIVASSVEQVFRRKYYRRAFRLLKLIYEEFSRFLVKKGMPAGIDIINIDLIKEIKNLKLKLKYHFTKLEATFQNPRFKSYVSQIFDEISMKRTQ